MRKALALLGISVAVISLAGCPAQKDIVQKDCHVRISIARAGGNRLKGATSVVCKRPPLDHTMDETFYMKAKPSDLFSVAPGPHAVNDSFSMPPFIRSVYAPCIENYIYLLKVHISASFASGDVVTRNYRLTKVADSSDCGHA